MNLRLVTTARLQLRAPRLDDLPAFFAIHSDPRTNHFNPSGPLTSWDGAKQDLQNWLNHWRRYGFGYWAVVLHSQPDQVIGFGGLRYREIQAELHPNLYFRFRPEAWGHGYATELGQTALHVGFEDLKLEQIIATVRFANLNSIKVLERLGLKRQGEILDEYGPSLIYLLAKDDYCSPGATR